MSKEFKCPDCGRTITGPSYPKLHTCNPKDVISYLRAELATHRWIPVSERLPEVPDGPPNASSEIVWLIHKGKTEKGYYTNFTGWRICGSYFNQNTVQKEITYWKPITLPQETG